MFEFYITVNPFEAEVWFTPQKNFGGGGPRDPPSISLYIFEKPLPRQIKICKKICKIFLTKFVFKDTENVQILFQGICAKTMQNFLASFCSRLSKEL